MGDDNSDSREKLWFPSRLRELRVEAGKKQREIAEVLKLTPSSYANAESANHKRISRERVDRLIRFYKLDDEQARQLVAGWEALPESEYNARQRTSYEKRKAFRSKARNHDRLKLALLEVTTQLVTTAPDPDALCSCPEVDMFADEPDEPPEPCELCNALRLLGLVAWTDRDDVIGKLAAAQEGLVTG